MNKPLNQTDILQILSPYTLERLHFFVRDLSFENPLMPFSLIRPELAVVNVHSELQVRDIQNAQKQKAYDLCLTVTAEVLQDEKQMMIIEISQCAIVKLAETVPDTFKVALLHVKGAEMLYEEARERIERMTQEFGVPPLRLPDADFVSGFMQMPDFSDFVRAVVANHQQIA